MENLEQNERIITETEKEELARTLGSLGLYDASRDIYPLSEHPEDDRWIIKGEK